MIALALALVAHASPPPDHAELADAEADSVALIATCEAHGTACGASAEALGEAFLVRGAAAAVLRGEIDTVAAANARWLAPEAALAWRSLLPKNDGEPEAWVRAWRPEVAARPVPTPSPKPSPTRAPNTFEAAPWRLGDGHPHVIRLDGLGVPGLERLAVGGAGDARLGVAGPLTAYVGLGLEWERQGVDLSPLGSDVNAVDAATGHARVGLGPRWTSGNGGEVMPYAYGVVDWGAATWATYEALYDDGLEIDPGNYGLGGGIGAVAVHPVARHLAIGWDARVEVLKRWMQADYTDGRRRDDLELPDVDRDAHARDHVDGALRADLRWRPAGGHTTLSLGGLMRIETALESADLPATGTKVRAGPLLGVGWIL